MFFTLTKKKKTEKIWELLAALHLQPVIWEHAKLSMTDSPAPYNSDL